MPQRIRCVDGREARRGIAQVLGCDATALAGGVSLLWTQDRRVAGAAHVQGSAIERFALVGEGGGAIALARMAVAAAAHSGPEVSVCDALLDHEPIVNALRLAPQVTVDRGASRALDLPGTERLAWERHIFDRGEIIARLGDPAESLRVVARGSVRLVGVDHRNSPREIGQVGPGELLSDALLAGAPYEPIHVLAHAEQVDVMVVHRAVVEAHRYKPDWAEWIQRLLVRRIAAMSGRLLNGAEPQLVDHIVEILVDLARGPAAGRCSLKWLAEQVGVHTQRAKVLLEPLWEAVAMRGDSVLVVDARALLAFSGVRAPKRRELVLCQPAL